MKEIIAVAQDFAMKAQDAIGQLLKEKQELQTFAHTAVEQYNISASRHHKLSLAYDAL